jgi:DNA modification methylase
MQSGLAKLIISSPPYNVGKEYEKRSSVEAYIAFMRATLAESVRVLSEGGSLCWQVGSMFDSNGALVLIDKLVDNIMDELGPQHKLRLQNRIVWHFGHGLHSSNRFSGRYETVLWYTKGRDYTFNLDAVRVPQKYPGKKSYKGPRAGDFSGHPLGKNPSDFWYLGDGDVWDIPNVKNNHVEKLGHPCQFPIDLAARLILALSHAGDIVLDPFGGVGTSAAAAVYLGRRAISIDLQKKYSHIARKRVREAWNGTLRFRPSATPMSPPISSPLTVVPEAFTTARAKQKLIGT